MISKTSLLLICALASGWPIESHARAQKHNFSVYDDIGLTHFGNLYGGDTKAITLSPNGHLVIVHSERGSLLNNRLVDELRVYDLDEVRRVINGLDEPRIPKPIWTIHEATNSEGENWCLISRIRWLKQSTGFAFLLRNGLGHVQLHLADLRTRRITPLTAGYQDVTGFEIRDKTHYVVAILSKKHKKNGPQEVPAAVVVSQNQSALEAVFSKDLKNSGDRSELWAAAGGPTAPVSDPKTGMVITLYSEGINNLALSPDGSSVITVVAVKDIPKGWEARFPPPYPGSSYALKAGPQDLTSLNGVLYVGEYALIKLKGGATTLLAATPTAERAGWWANEAAPAWSDDGKAVILPGVFPADQSISNGRPCVVVKELALEGALQCVEPFKRNLASGFEEGYVVFQDVQFGPGTKDQVVIGYQTRDPQSNDMRRGFKTFARLKPGMWQLQEDKALDPTHTVLNLEVKMSYKQPPTLVATDNATGRSQEIWNPNPQLREINLGEPSLFQWKDATGRAWHAILYKPLNYVAGHRYPLVIETHGYDESLFEPSGGFPTAFAAQELASAGIMVLHMQDCAGRATPTEGSCNVMGYESGVEELTNEGLVDPAKVGITGFSRTVFYVMEALTCSKLHFVAASVTDGINIGYFQHILHSGADAWTKEDFSIIGAEPIGRGLERWLERSPEFNLDKVSAPLRIVGGGKNRAAALYMWEPYALLREMNKPVEFVMLDTDEHILTSPAIRLAAQEGNVDWFRFWIQGYKDPDPAKADQYKRWETLRAEFPKDIQSQ